MIRNIIFVSCLITLCYGIAEYQKEHTENADGLPKINLRTLDRPFRMAKLNLLWTKATHVSFQINYQILS